MTKTDRPIPLFDRGIIPLFLPLLQEFDLESVFFNHNFNLLSHTHHIDSIEMNSPGVKPQLEPYTCHVCIARYGR